MEKNQESQLIATYAGLALVGLLAGESSDYRLKKDIAATAAFDRAEEMVAEWRRRYEK